MIAVAVILRFLGIVFVIKSVNDDDFNFHFFWNDAFYVNACLLTCFYAVLTFCKSCKVRGKFYKRTVVFYTAYNSRNGFACTKVVWLLNLFYFPPNFLHHVMPCM